MSILFGNFCDLSLSFWSKCRKISNEKKVINELFLDVRSLSLEPGNVSILMWFIYIWHFRIFSYLLSQILDTSAVSPQTVLYSHVTLRDCTGSSIITIDFPNMPYKLCQNCMGVTTF